MLGFHASSTIKVYARVSVRALNVNDGSTARILRRDSKQTEVKKSKQPEITNWHFFETKEEESELLTSTPPKFFGVFFFLSI